MDLNKQNILFFTRTMMLGGTENVILQLCKILKPLVNRIVVCSCGGVNVEKLSDMDIKHYQIPDIENKKPSTLIRTVNIVNKVIKMEKITIIHTHHRMASFYIHLLKTNGAILVSTLHGVFNNKRILTRLAYKDIQIIACGNVVKENFIQQFGIKSEKITVIHNAILKDNSEMIEVDELRRTIQKEIIIGYIGRLSKEKGVDILVESIPEILNKVKNILFVFVGDGLIKDDLERQIERLKLKDNTLFLGYRSDVQNLIKQVDIIVLPSLTEGLPLTPIEAFAQGKPVVATNAGGTVEIVKNGVNGILVPIGDSAALAEGIVKLCENDDLKNSMSKEAISTYEAEYSYEIFKNSIIKYYESL